MNIDISKIETNEINLKSVVDLVLTELVPELKPTDENFNFISEKIKVISLNKGEYFIKEGKISDNIGILLDQKSVLKAYYYDSTGKKRISRFFYSPDNIIVSSFESFREKTPARENIVAVNNCKLLTIERENLYNIYKEIPAFNAVGRILMETSYINALSKLREFQTLQGHELVKSFYLKNKGLINTLEIQDIASYLGLSRNKFSDHLKSITKTSKKNFAPNGACKEK
jgi:hypothetical protein